MLVEKEKIFRMYAPVYLRCHSLMFKFAHFWMPQPILSFFTISINDIRQHNEALQMNKQIERNCKRISPNPSKPTFSYQQTTTGEMF